jgi:hypothetical protein
VGGGDADIVIEEEVLLGVVRQGRAGEGIHRRRRMLGKRDLSLCVETRERGNEGRCYLLIFLGAFWLCLEATYNVAYGNESVSWPR